MEVEVSHSGKRMVCCRAASDPAIMRTLAVRVLCTIWLVFSPAFLNSVPLTTVRTDKMFIHLGGISTMLGLLVLFHPLCTGILLTTVWNVTFLPWTQANVCLFHIFLLARTLPQFVQGYFSPQCTPCVPSAIGGSWRTADTQDSPWPPLGQQGSGKGPQWPP